MAAILTVTQPTVERMRVEIASTTFSLEFLGAYVAKVGYDDVGSARMPSTFLTAHGTRRKHRDTNRQSGILNASPRVSTFGWFFSISTLHCHYCLTLPCLADAAELRHLILTLHYLSLHSLALLAHTIPWESGFELCLVEFSKPPSSYMHIPTSMRVDTCADSAFCPPPCYNNPSLLLSPHTHKPTDAWNSPFSHAQF
ncbi:uncharacterized protein CLUP02_16473 [Colletotrichum lupini]|uniref:Uncharacterized protein n=1 Tax=Colletotrichum lupini TaxID=145971 RepID=A0A9Q8TA64_9PEZI|nr:uncharacterized protein CLUP02_16473 [Colletotrichum lupini]UQC90941.1 hypothetical protein CLUP02_16473 [Colletotrichum lupini]